MDEKSKDLMERYIYEVIRRVPRNTREEIRLELLELISDMMEHENLNMEEVLMKLGNPAEFAKRYRDEKKYVIGPEYYDNYVWVMKIVLAAVILSNVVSNIVQIVTGQFSGTDYLFNRLITDLIVGVIGAFGMVTLVFAVMERYRVKIELQQSRAWTTADLPKDTPDLKNKIKTAGWVPERLPKVPDKKGLISRGDCIAGIVFTVLFAAILIGVPHFLGAWKIENDVVQTIPVLNLETKHIWLPVILFSLTVGMTEEIVKLIAGRYCIGVVIINLISAGVTIVTSVALLKVLPFWNLNFASELEKMFHKNINSRGDLLFYWGTDKVANIVLAFIVLCVVLDVTVTIYKTIRYGEKN